MPSALPIRTYSSRCGWMFFTTRPRPHTQVIAAAYRIVLQGKVYRAVARTFVETQRLGKRPLQHITHASVANLEGRLASRERWGVVFLGKVFRGRGRVTNLAAGAMGCTRTCLVKQPVHGLQQRVSVRNSRAITPFTTGRAPQQVSPKLVTTAVADTHQNGFLTDRAPNRICTHYRSIRESN